MKNKHNRGTGQKLARKRLTSEEIRKYESFGEVDMSQNWLEFFTVDRIQDLNEILHSKLSNQDKCDTITEELQYYGFEPVGLGTNVYAMSNPAYPGVVFKFALDTNGLADNFNDEVLCDLVNEYLGEERYTRVLARHPSGLVSVHERKAVIKTQDRMDEFRGSILRTLKRLSEKFLIVDLSPSLYPLNYGINRDGSWCFIDASDLYPLANMKEPPRCKRVIKYKEKSDKQILCGGRFYYNDDYSKVICSECGGELFPLEIRPKEKEVKMISAITDGTSAKEREYMRQQEIVRFASGKVKTIPVDTTVPPTTVAAKTEVVTKAPETETPKSAAPVVETAAKPVPPLPSMDEPVNVVIRKAQPQSQQVRPGFAPRAKEAEPVQETPTKVPEPVPLPVTEEVMKSVVIPRPAEEDDDAFSEEEDTPKFVPVQPTVSVTEPAYPGLSDDDDEGDEEGTIEMVDREPEHPDPVGRQRLNDSDDDDESDEEIANRFVSSFDDSGDDEGGEDDNEDEGDDENDEGETLVESTIDYVINSDENDSDAGIYVNIKGDPFRAIARLALPIRLSMDGGKSYTTIIDYDGMTKLLRQAVNEYIADMSN